MTFSAIVLAGGASRRMGREKATMVGPDGRTLLACAVDAVRAAGAEDVVVAAGDNLTALAGAVPDGVTLVQDARPGLGPIGGLEAGLRHAGHPWSIAVACDMPTIDPAILRDLVGRADEAWDAVVPVADGWLQPLHAAYHRRALPALQAALAENRLGLTRALDALNVLRVEAPSGATYRNVNTPADLEALSDGADPSS